MRDPENHKRIGSFIGLKVVHEPQFGSGLVSHIGFMIHELDHAVREVLDGDKEQFETEDRIVLEGTAEFARHRFSEVQDQSSPSIVYGLNNVLMLEGGIYAEDTEVRENLKHTYASGLVLAERMSHILGMDEFFELGYNSQKTFDPDELSILRQRIAKKLKGLKAAAKNFLVDF